jgi:hypothetical protein
MGKKTVSVNDIIEIILMLPNPFIIFELIQMA